MYGKRTGRLMDTRQAYGKWLLLAGLFTALTMGLTGCNEITGTSPSATTIVEMQPGETKLFKVFGPTETPILKCVWSIRGEGTVLEGSNEFLYELDPESVTSNRKIIWCSTYLFRPYRPCYDPSCGWSIGWRLEDQIGWEVRVRQNTSPIWQGVYYICDKTDMQLLKGYTDVTGDLLIGTDPSMPVSTVSDITSLEDLNAFNTIGGNLDIRENANLTSLAGLQNLTAVGGDICIEENPVLSSLAGFPNLAAVEGDLSISSNAVLTSLAELQNITAVGGNLSIDYNAALTSLTGIQNITAVGGGLSIYANDALTSLAGIPSISAVGGGLSIGSNAALTSLAELQNITAVGGGLSINYNAALTSLTGLQNITTIQGGIKICHNPALSSLTDFPDLTAVEGDLHFWNNDSLTSLAGLQNITAVEGNLYFSDNHSLTSLADLQNLATVGGSLYLVDNPSLSTLGLIGLLYIQNDFYVSHNQGLCTYLIEDLRDQVLGGGGIGETITIQGNKDCIMP